VTDTAFPLTEFHHPATFASRGVAAPFTTPMLAGARVRESQRTGIELVVPNPSGGRGVYILNWPGVRQLCHPTVHDTMLFRRLSRLPKIDPASVRDAALDVALEGHAGHEAMASAVAAKAHDRSQRLLAHFLLLTELVAQTDPNARSAMSAAEQAADLDRRASAALHRIAPSVGRPATELAAGLAAVGDAFAAVGVAVSDRDSRIARLLSRVEQTRIGLANWLEADPENDIGGLGQAVTVAVGRACDSGHAVLAMARSSLTDPTALLRRWITDQPGVQACARRCEWLLDGWERVALLWLLADPKVPRRAALLEMAPLLPVLPREVMEWTDTPIPAEAMEQACRVTSREDAWRTGSSAFALIERNEKLLAMSA
jgi:hypothetical protein